MFDVVADALKDIPNLYSRNDDDFVDRMHHRWTVLVIVIGALVVGAKQYVGTPLVCWVPAHFTGSHESFTQSYCWVKNTYYLPWENEIPKAQEHSKRYEINYYQWVSLVLMGQALLFFIPIVFWRSMNSQSGIDVNDLVETSEKLQYCESSESKKKLLTLLTNQIDRSLRNSRKRTKFNIAARSRSSRLHHALTTVLFCFGKRLGNYMVIVYMFLKLLFAINLVLQFVIMKAFLGVDFTMFGYHLLHSFYRGEDHVVSPRFPRATMCDFRIRILGNVQRYTVQCVLPINLFSEKIYLFLWLWMVCLSVATVYNFFSWIRRLAPTNDRRNYIENYLKTSRAYDRSLSQDVAQRFQHFVDVYLAQDGVFVLRLIDYSTNPLIVQEVIVELWKLFNYRDPPALPPAPSKAAGGDDVPLRDMPGDSPGDADTLKLRE